jgi:hypothetical protein
MAVYDRSGQEIGIVEVVYMGGASDEAIEQGGNGAISPDIDLSGNDMIVESIAEAFAPDDLPRELAERSLNSGYIRLDSHGLFAADRYIVPDQISSVSNDSVRLRVPGDELVKRLPTVSRSTLSRTVFVQGNGQTVFSTGVLC